MITRYVKQRHDYGCAIAAIAMVTGASYRDVLRRAFPKGARRRPGPGRPLDLGVTPKKMANLIRSYGLKVRLSWGSHRTEEQLKTTAIMIFNWFPASDDVEGRHAVVWDPRKGVVLDPADMDNLGLEFYVRRWVQSGCSTLKILG